MAIKTKIIVQQLLNIGDTITTASKYPKYTVVMANSISSITAGELTSAVEASAASATESANQASLSEQAKQAALAAQTAAETAATNSANSAAQSTASKDAAKISETNAAESKRLAEAARDAANSSAGIYQDTTSGLAGTATGGYFSVPSPLDDEVLILYRNDAGIATEVKRYPNAAGVENTRELMMATVSSLILTQSIIAAHHAFI